MDETQQKRLGLGVGGGRAQPPRQQTPLKAGVRQGWTQDHGLEIYWRESKTHRTPSQTRKHSLLHPGSRAFPLERLNSKTVEIQQLNSWVLHYNTGLKKNSPCGLVGPRCISPHPLPQLWECIQQACTPSRKRLEDSSLGRETVGDKPSKKWWIPDQSRYRKACPTHTHTHTPTLPFNQLFSTLYSLTN